MAKTLKLSFGSIHLGYEALCKKGASNPVGSLVSVTAGTNTKKYSETGVGVIVALVPVLIPWSSPRLTESIHRRRLAPHSAPPTHRICQTGISPYKVNLITPQGSQLNHTASYSTALGRRRAVDSRAVKSSWNRPAPKGRNRVAYPTTSASAS